MRLRSVCTRISRGLADPVMRWKVNALMGGKMIGLALRLLSAADSRVLQGSLS
jgi:hypothetical protein